MAWPKNTKASTANVDAGTDLIANARPDIKQNIDNVNAIIDEFNISSPNDGDLLQYSSSTGKWEQVTSSSLTSMALVGFTSGEELVSGNTYRQNFNITFDPNNMLSKNGTYQMVLTAGNYIFFPSVNIAGENEATVFIHDEDADSSIAQFVDSQEIGTTTEGVMVGQRGLTVSSTTNISFRQTAVSASNRSVSLQFIVFKL